MSGNIDRMTTLDILALIVGNKKTVMTITALAMLAGIVTSLLLPVRYKATTQLTTPQQTQSAALMLNQLGSSAASSMAALTAGGLGLRTPNEIYIGMLGSRTIADAIIHHYDLMAIYRAKDMTAARKQLAVNTKITSEKSGLISISVTDKDKRRAADIANSYTDELGKLAQSMAASEASQRRNFYEEQLKEAKQELVKSEVSFQQVQQAKGVIQPQDQAKLMLERQASLRALAATKDVQLQTLRSYSTDRNPTVQLTQKELAALNSAVAQIDRKRHSEGFSDLGLGDVPAAGIDYLSAQHEVLTRQTLYDLLIKQYDAAKLDGSKTAMIIQVVAPAIPPDRKDSPHRTIIVLLFTAVGFSGVTSYLSFKVFLEKSASAAQTMQQLKLIFFTS